MSQAPRILFFPDGGSEVGGGHVMRCLTLARALMDRGATCAFVAPPPVAKVMKSFAPAGIQALFAPDADPVPVVREVQRLAIRFAPDWLVIDHYRLNACLEEGLRAPRRKLMVMDDLADRPRDCDLLLDPGYGRTAKAYDGLVPEWAKVLAGPAYALVRPEFAQARATALARRSQSPVRRVLVSLGLTDVGAISARVVEALLPALGEVAIDVALGAGSPSLARLKAQADPRVVLHVDATDMAASMTDAELCIGAGGSSVWERACLGLPAVTLVLADNQRDLARRMDADGLAVAVEAAGGDFEANLAAAFHSLSEYPALRQALSRRLAALCDGLGAERVAQAMLD